MRAAEQAVEAADRPRTAARSLTANRSTDAPLGDRPVKDTWIQRTGQKWKETVSIVFFALWVGNYLLSQAIGDLASLVIGLGTGLLCLYFSILAIRCPRCRCRPMWQLATQASLRSLFSWSLIQNCPICGDDSRRTVEHADEADDPAEGTSV